MSRVLAGGLIVAVVLAGCTTPMALEDYAAAAEGVTDAYVEESQALSFDYQSGVEDGVRAIVESGADDPSAEALDLVVASTVEYLALLSDAMRRYLVAIEALEPPDAVAAAHDAYVDAVDFVLGAIPDTRSAVEGAVDLDAVQLALTSSGFADGQLRWTATCTALEQAVRDEGRGIDLGCVRPEVAP